MMTSTQRFAALDVFRGMTIVFMILVNSPGNEATTYLPLVHAQWDGFSLADLVFPSFLFAMGNSLGFAAEKWQLMSRAKVFWKIFKRTVIIFLLGFAMHWLPSLDQQDTGYIFVSWHTVRILGVLQRIALAYFLASFIICFSRPKAIIIISSLILIGYWGVLYLFGDAGSQLTLAGNAIRKVDLFLMGQDHMPKPRGVAFELEGWLGTFPAVVNILAGYLVCRFIRQQGKSHATVAWLMLIGFVLFTTACLWDLGFPINKKLWTSAFVVYSIGLDCLILASVIFIVDLLEKKRAAGFFEVFGKNPLFIYIFSEVGAYLLYNIKLRPGMPLANWLFDNIFQHAGLYFGSLLYSIGIVLLCWLVAWWMDKRSVYIRV